MWVTLVVVGITWGLLAFTSRFKPVNTATKYSMWTGSFVLILLVHAMLWMYRPAEPDATRRG
ncbi:hypothetical protein HQ496_12875 [bacterium]|nr:hypothetical protein [bacterium]